jgi:thiamine-phosphate pyrophosphorylase
MTAGQPSWRGLYAILDLPHAGGLDPVAAARALVGASVTEIGAKILQLRAKRASSAERTGLAAGALLIVDDDIDAAMLADGVHLGQEDLAALAGEQAWEEALGGLRRRAAPGFLIGLSTHDRAQVLRSAGLPVDYIGFGPILPTRSKANPDPWVGIDELRTVCEISSHPVVAIGGLAGPDALACVRAGAAAAAMIGALAGASVAEVRGRAASLASALRTVEGR